MTTTRRAERLAFVALVLAGHVLLLWAWRFAATPAPREAPRSEPPLVTLRMTLPPTPPPAVKPPPAAVVPAPRSTAAQRVREPRGVPAPAPPIEATTATPSAVPAPITAAPAAAAASSPDLDLQWPPRAAGAPAERSLKDRMLNDPRSNSPRPTVGSRVAAVAGTPQWTEERMDATRTRLRKDGRCIEVHFSRNAQIDPWNQNFAPTPKAVKPDC